MSEDLAQIWREYRADTVGPGAIVIDIGCSEGYFTDWAVSRGAIVESFDARYGTAVGPYDGFCAVKDVDEDSGHGAYIVPGEGDTPMISLETILADYDAVDFLKCDIEGGEYLIFDCDLSKVRAFGMEFHAWTTPDDAPMDGVGVKDEPMPANALDTLIRKLERTHEVEIVGNPTVGGYLYGTRRT